MVACRDFCLVFACSSVYVMVHACCFSVGRAKTLWYTTGVYRCARIYTDHIFDIYKDMPLFEVFTSDL